MNRKPVRVQRSAPNPRTPVMVLAAFILAILAVLAIMYWLFVSNDMKKDGNDFNVGAVSANDSQTNSEGNQGDSNESNSEEGPKFETVAAEKVVPETKRVDAQYFDDALFIGDSVSVGLRVNGIFQPQNVLAQQNAGLDKAANDKPMYKDASNNDLTLIQAVSALTFTPKKIYVLLGLNSLGYEESTHINYYYTVVDKLKNKFPDAVIYVESLTPRAVEVKSGYAKVTKEKLNSFNELIKKMAAEKDGVYYLSVTDGLVGEDGYMKPEYAEVDGIHMKSVGHRAMYEYYATHAVLQKDGKNVVEKIIK